MPNPSEAVLDRKSRPIYEALNRGDTKVRKSFSGHEHPNDALITTSFASYCITSIVRALVPRIHEDCSFLEQAASERV
jgi:hypothetical protein